MHDSKIFSFWDLIDSHQITIPIIQRDYVQGREDKEVEVVRHEFLRVLFQALKTGEPVELDFIYGTVDQAGRFSPLDGQQRLTTLFLLHWYIALREGELAENQETFRKFTYETRMSSKLFCRLLVSLTDLNLTESKLSTQIQNESGFYYDWVHDQTVVSMLGMIDAIHSFAGQDDLPHSAFQMLKTNAPVRFRFIDLETFQLEDALYIKMNARGKPLTPFENFKARFQQYLEAIHYQDGNLLMNKMDTIWSDYFWKHKQQEYDESFLQFFYAILYNQLARHSRNRDRLFTAVNQGDAIRFEELDELQVDGEAWLKDIEQTLDALDNGAIFNEDTVVPTRDIIFATMEGGINYTERVQLYALVSYIRTYGNDFSALARWMRFIRNVSVNTTYNRIEEFMQSVQAIDSLIHHARQLDEYIAETATKMSGFLSSQLMQERLKGRMVLQDGGWRQVLAVAEDYPYFQGDINFLLRYINADQISEQTTATHHQKIAEFEMYYKKAIAIFGGDRLRVSNNLLSRALLTFGDYLVQAGRNRSFLIEGFDRDISWKRFLRHDNAIYLQQLLDCISPAKVEEDLETIVRQHTVTDWRRHFIQYPLILKECCGNKRFIRFKGEKDILLLDTTMTSGYCQEYYSYAVYSELQLQGIACKYEPSIGAYNDKYVDLEENGYSLNYVDELFYIYDKENEVVDTTSDFEEAVQKMVAWESAQAIG